MKKARRISFIVAACLICAGLLVCVCTLLMLGLDATELYTADTVRQSFAVEEDFTRISARGETLQVVVELSQTGKAAVRTVTGEKMSFDVKTENGELIIRQIDNRAWYDYLVIGSGKALVTVSLPEKQYETLIVRGGSGDVYVPQDISFESVDMEVSSGSIDFNAGRANDLRLKTTSGAIKVINTRTNNLFAQSTTGSLGLANVSAKENIVLKNTTGGVVVNGVECQVFSLVGTTGNVTLKDAVATELLSVERSTGSVKFDRSDGGEIKVRTTTGGVSGSLRSGKQFDASSSSGKVSVPPSVSGAGLCTVRTGTGSISLSVDAQRQPSEEQS